VHRKTAGGRIPSHWPGAQEDIRRLIRARHQTVAPHLTAASTTAAGVSKTVFITSMGTQRRFDECPNSFEGDVHSANVVKP
jgi:hypothetical protein